MKRYSINLMIVLLLSALALTACSAPTATPQPTATATSAPATTAPGEAQATVQPGGPELALARVEKPEQEPLARVNGKEILWADYQPELVRTVNLVTQQYGIDWNDQANLDMVPTLQDEVLRQVTARFLLRQLATSEGVATTSEEIVGEIEKQKTSILTSGSYAAWEDFLKESGFDDAYFRRLVEDMVLVDKLSAKYAPERQVEQAHVRHILVDADTKAKEVGDKLKAGGDFAALAKEYSTDSGSKENGGDLGWFPRGAMVLEFENAAFSQPIGQVGEPVQSQYGYHIIEVLERGQHDMDDQTYEQAKQQAFSEWFSKQVDGANVETLAKWAPEQPTPAAPSATTTPKP